MLFQKLAKLSLPFLLAALFGWGITAVVPTARAQTPTSVITSLAANQDNTLFSESSNSNGAGPSIFAGRTGANAGTGIRRAVLAFDLSSIPAGATIVSATLQLHLSKAPSGASGEAFTLHPLTSDWGEGSSIAPGAGGAGTAATTDDATWVSAFHPSTAWTTPGGDFVATASATQTVGTTITFYTWHSAGLAQDVQAWLDTPATNFGWILRGNEAGTKTARRFDSRQSATAAFRPQLWVEYTVPAGTPLVDVTLTGPLTGTIATNTTFTATVSPLTVTLPITYIWQATDQMASTQTGGGLSGNIAYTWATTGTKLITVTADNGVNMVTDTWSVEIASAPPTPSVPLASVTISGPLTGTITSQYSFTATVAPLTATLPITYIWQATDQMASTQTGGGLSGNIAYTWATTGTKLITVTADNGVNVVTGTWSVEIATNELAVGITAAKDNTLYQDTLGGLSNGAGDYFFVGRTGGGSARRGVLAFDVATALPSNATVVSVTLQLHLSKDAGGVHDLALHSLTADWGEGTDNAAGEEGAGAPATAGSATWLHQFYTDTLWSNAGGDFAAVASASTAVAAEGFYTWSTPGMVQDVQAWLDAPSANYGWLVMGNEAANNTAKRFDTRENPTAANRPVLLVTYVLDTAPQTAVYLPLVMRP